MATWLLRRALLALPVVAGVTALTFMLIHLAPGDPIILLAGDGGTPAYYQEMRSKYGLDLPLLQQFGRYVRAVATGDLGYSFMFQAPVLGLLLSHVGASLLLGTSALLLATVLGIGSGVLAAVTRSTLVDASIRVIASFAYAAPIFWMGQVLVLVTAVQWGLLPVAGMSSPRAALSGPSHVLDVAWHLILPTVTMALPLAAVITRVTRASMLEALREPYVLATYARGVSARRVVARHVLPNAIVPVAVLIGQHAANIVAGAALTEALFGWPGVGYLVLHASLHRDYPLVTATFIAISSGVVIVNACADATVAWLDPRVRLT